MDAIALAREYLDAVEAGDADRLLDLFAADAVVRSPLYGELPAAEFFPRMLGDTARAELELLGAAAGATVGGGRLAIWHSRFDWALAGGGDIVGADMVHVAELDADGRITVFTIVYDTAAARPVWTAAHPQ
jgi:ketosteroid isomerase-like protein